MTFRRLARLVQLNATVNATVNDERARCSDVQPQRTLVVVAEDEDDLREALAEAIVDAGFDVIAVADVPNLERVLDTHRPDVLLADFQLFDQTTEAVVTLVATRRMVPRVAIVSAAPAARVVAERLAVQHIAKPFDLGHVLNLIADVSESRRAG